MKFYDEGDGKIFTDKCEREILVSGSSFFIGQYSITRHEKFFVSKSLSLFERDKFSFSNSLRGQCVLIQVSTYLYESRIINYNSAMNVRYKGSLESLKEIFYNLWIIILVGKHLFSTSILLVSKICQEGSCYNFISYMSIPWYKVE